MLFSGIFPVSAYTAERTTYERLIKTGAGHIETGNYEAARNAFVDALRYNERGSAAHLGLGIAYFYLHDDFSAERELLTAADLDPKSTDAYAWLGEVSYRKNDLESSVRFWEKAVELSPSTDNLRTRLERIKKEHKTEKDFNQDITSHFLIKYEGREKIEAGRIILRILEDAYSEVGKAISYYPDREIQVILYSSQQFQEVTDAPGWSGGIYDGKIRIPVGGIDKESAGLRKLLFHEYTHAVMKSLAPRCPTWLNEGLAQYFEGRETSTPQRDLIRKAIQSGKIPSLAQLEGSFTSLNSSQAMVAYTLSLSSVRYMIDTFGLYRVRIILDELGTGLELGKAIDRGIQISYEDFERGWKRSLE